MKPAQSFLYLQELHWLAPLSNFHHQTSQFSGFASPGLHRPHHDDGCGDESVVQPPLPGLGVVAAHCDGDG